MLLCFILIHFNQGTISYHYSCSGIVTLENKAAITKHMITLWCLDLNSSKTVSQLLSSFFCPKNCFLLTNSNTVSNTRTLSFGLWDLGGCYPLPACRYHRLNTLYYVQVKRFFNFNEKWDETKLTIDCWRQRSMQYKILRIQFLSMENEREQKIFSWKIIFHQNISFQRFFFIWLKTKNRQIKYITFF